MVMVFAVCAEVHPSYAVFSHWLLSAAEKGLLKRIRSMQASYRCACCFVLTLLVIGTQGLGVGVAARDGRLLRQPLSKEALFYLKKVCMLWP